MEYILSVTWSASPGLQSKAVTDRTNPGCARMRYALHVTWSACHLVCMSPGLHIFQTGSTPSRHNNTYIKWIAVYSDSKASSHCLASKPALGGRPPFCGASRRFIVTPLWPMMRGSTVQEKQAINRKDGDTAADMVSTPGPSIPESSPHVPALPKAKAGSRGFYSQPKNGQKLRICNRH